MKALMEEISRGVSYSWIKCYVIIYLLILPASNFDIYILITALNKAWRECPICNQHYQGDHRLSIADAFVQFVDQLDDCDPFRYAEALWVKMLALDDNPEESRETCRQMIAKLEEVDEPYKCGSWVKFPEAYCSSVKNLLSLAYEKLGWWEFKEAVRKKDDDKFNAALKYYEKYQRLASAIGNTTHANDAAAKIARTRALISDGETEQDFAALWKAYENDKSGLNVENLVLALRFSGHEIEVERLIANHLILSKRVLGPGHPTVLEQEYGLKGMSVRRVMLEEDEDGLYRFVRYEEDGSCVLAPMANSHDFPGGNAYEGSGREFTIDAADMSTKIRLSTGSSGGTPVKCVGLKGAAHLNGKIGDARKYDKETERYVVHFEDKSVQPQIAKVKMQNLQLLVDLPPNANGS